MTVKEKIQIKNGYISKPEAMDHSLKIKAQNLLWEYNNTRPDENAIAGLVAENFGIAVVAKIPQLNNFNVKQMVNMNLSY